jgi:hypothetical protein
VLQLAKNAGLPEYYIYKISQMPFKIDPDDDRRQEELSKIKG